MHLLQELIQPDIINDTSVVITGLNIQNFCSKIVGVGVI